MANTYTLISSSTVGSGGASSIDFTSIPQTYTDLLIKYSIRTTGAAIATGGFIKFNSSTTGYTYRRLEGTGAAAGSQNGSDRYAGVDTGTSATASTFSNAEVYIPNYAGSTNKSYSADSVSENNATTAYTWLVAGLWSNTAAITSISLSDDTYNLGQYSTAYLYGISNS
jgi:hypothetical protein